jgi:hypothetical protein
MARSDYKARRRRWSADEIEYLRRNYGKKNILELAQKLGRKVTSVDAAVCALCLEKSKQDNRPKK